MKSKKKKILKAKTVKLVKKPKKVLIIKKKIQKKIIKKTKKIQKPKISVKKIVPIVKPKKTVKKIVRKNTPKIKPSFLAESFFKAKIKVIGIGGGGGSIVSEIGRSLNKATFVVADTDTRAFKKRAGIKNFLFGQALTHGLGTGVNPQLGRQAAEAEKEKISHLFDDQDIVIFIASLGGGLGSGATQVFAEAARDFNGITLGIFTLPFKFEGKNKFKIAARALKELRKVLSVSITIPNERIFKIIETNTAITDAFSIVNKNLIESLESLIELIYSPGIINIDFADLRAILSGRGNLAFLNTNEASGKNRADFIAENILHNPLYQNNNFKTEKILFNISGGENLNLFEINKISSAISEKHKSAKIIFGISKNAKFKNKIKTTLLMTGPSSETPVQIVAPVIKETAKEKVAVVAKKKVISKTKKTEKVINKAKKPKELTPQKPLVPDKLVPVFDDAEFTSQPAEFAFKRLNVVEPPVKKAIRRSALDIKKAEEEKENEQSIQEKEWEIPAFLRIKK